MFQFQGVFYENARTEGISWFHGTTDFINMTPEETAQIPWDDASHFSSVGGEYMINFPWTRIGERFQRGIRCIWATPVDNIYVHVLMGTHARLGENSLLRHLDRELLFKIFEIAKPDRFFH